MDFETGSILLQEFPGDVVLLDDGFQHVKLARNVDVVLLPIGWLYQRILFRRPTVTPTAEAATPG